MKVKHSIVTILGLAIILITTTCGGVVSPDTTVVILSLNGECNIYKNDVYKKYGRDEVYFLDTKLKSYSKNLKIPCAVDIDMKASVKWIGSFDVTNGTIDIIKLKVPARKSKRDDLVGLELILDKFYDIVISDIVPSITRIIIFVYKTDNIQKDREVIRNDIKLNILKRLKELNYPVTTADILITYLDYPAVMTKMGQWIKNTKLVDLENTTIAKSDISKIRRDAELGKAKLVNVCADAADIKVGP